MALLEATVSKSRKTYAPGTEQVTSRLDTYILKALPEDLLTVLRGVAMQELDGQITSGNLPSSIIVDGRSVAKRQILEARRSISMRFADVRSLMDAVKEAYQLLLRTTRIQSPPKNNIVARQHFWLYKSGVAIGRLPGALSKLNPATLDSNSVLRIVGPLVNYGRKSYWNPIGRAKIMDFYQTTSLAGRDILHYASNVDPRFKPYRMRTMRKIANGMGGDPAENLKRMLDRRPGHVESVGQIVRRVMSRDRRFVGLHISDGWISYPPAGSWGKHSKDDRVPTISVQLSRKGRVSVVSSL